MKLKDALFREPYESYYVSRTENESDVTSRDEEYLDWNLEPLMGPTLAKEYVQPRSFEGVFIVKGKIASLDSSSEDCYLEIVLPERICEHHFVRLNDQIVKCRGRLRENGTAVPAIGIEQFGNYKLFYSKEQPEIGIDVLQKALRCARNKRVIGYDLGLLLRDEKQYEDAIKAFSDALDETTDSEIAYIIHKERAELYRTLGDSAKAEQDESLWAAGFARRYGHFAKADDSV
jgi:tetratricopeptide (TPR) repeat protein